MNEIQEQYHKLLNFVEYTPSIEAYPYYDGEYWVGSFPYYFHVDKYDPSLITGDEEPVACLWYGYLLDIYVLAHELEGEDKRRLLEHLRKSKELNIDDLLDASESEMNDYYSVFVHMFKSQYKHLIE